MIIWLLIFFLVILSQWLSTTNQSGGSQWLARCDGCNQELNGTAPYPFFGNGPYVWPLFWSVRNPYFWPPPNQMGFPIRWMGKSASLPLPVPDDLNIKAHLMPS